MPDPIRPTALHQVALFAHDLDRATAFYRDVLGLTFLFSAPPGMSFFDCGGVRVLIGNAAASGPNPPRSMLYWRVGNIEEASRRLAAHGVDVGKGPAMIAKLPDREVWLLEFEDSEGNASALMQERVNS
jgi:methylmalonyl-CoA/ethylmalonyl-CoA epimerase